jgi:putative PIG3 family NAD(P)H quinone oxidoreductase
LAIRDGQGLRAISSWGLPRGQSGRHRKWLRRPAHILFQQPGAGRGNRREDAAVKFLELSRQAGRYSARLVEGPEPSARPGEVLVRVAASGVNRADLSQASGSYPPPPGESSIPGLEVSGTAVDTGEPVCALLAGGGHAEIVAVPRGQLFPAPRSLPLLHAAAIPEAFLTAFANLAGEGGLAAGDTVLVHAGASGAGLAAIAVARFLGARVAATTRSHGKLPALLEAGAELAIDSTEEDFAAVIRARWGRNAVHIVLDPVGAATLAGDLDVLATGGRVIFLATMSGARAELDLRALMSRRARLIGSTLRSRSREEKAVIVSGFRDRVLSAFESGSLRVTIDSIYPATRATEAFERMAANRNVGKMLIQWN